MKIDPYLSKLSKTKEQLDKELQQELHTVTKQDPPCLATTIRNRWKADSSYDIPKSTLTFRSLADVVNNKQFGGYYPESYGTVADYFQNKGISPYYEIVPGGDYAKGTLTINTMIELTNNNVKWRLAREQDVGLIIGICEAYQGQLKQVLRPDSTNITDIHRRAYYTKLNKFLDRMYQYAKIMQKRTGFRLKVADLTEIAMMYEGV